MFRLWGKIFKDNRMLQDAVICNSDYTMSRTAMIFDAMDQLCYQFDLGHPVWLDATVEEFKRHDKARDRVCSAQRETVFFTVSVHMPVSDSCTLNG